MLSIPGLLGSKGAGASAVDNAGATQALLGLLGSKGAGAGTVDNAGASQALLGLLGSKGAGAGAVDNAGASQALLGLLASTGAAGTGKSGKPPGKGKGKEKKGKNPAIGPDGQPKVKKALCKNFEAGGECRFGQWCNFAHSVDELAQAPLLVLNKKGWCKNFLAEGQCKFGDWCNWAHDEIELHPIVPHVEAFIQANGLDERSSQLLRVQEDVIISAVIERGSLKSCGNPSAACATRIRELQAALGISKGVGKSASSSEAPAPALGVEDTAVQADVPGMPTLADLANVALNGQVLNGQVLNGQVLNGQVLNGQASVTTGFQDLAFQSALMEAPPEWAEIEKEWVANKPSASSANKPLPKVVMPPAAKVVLPPGKVVPPPNNIAEALGSGAVKPSAEWSSAEPALGTSNEADSSTSNQAGWGTSDQSNWGQASQGEWAPTLPKVPRLRSTGQTYIGRVKLLKENHGFITCEEVREQYGGVDVFCGDYSQLEGRSVGQLVAFDLVLNKEGKPQACNVQDPPPENKQIAEAENNSLPLPQVALPQVWNQGSSPGVSFAQMISGVTSSDFSPGTANMQTAAFDFSTGADLEPAWKRQRTDNNL